MENRKLILKHLQQGPNQCGPTALAIVLDYWGRPVQLAEIVKAIKPLDFMFCASGDLLSYARAQGLVARASNGCGWEDLTGLLRQGIPAIALIDPDPEPDWNLHYVVVNGYVEDGVEDGTHRRVFYIDPAQGAGSGQREQSWAEFSRHWAELKLNGWRTGYDRYLVAVAPAKATSAFPPADAQHGRPVADLLGLLACRAVNGAAHGWRALRDFAWFLRPRRFDT